MKTWFLTVLRVYRNTCMFLYVTCKSFATVLFRVTSATYIKLTEAKGLWKDIPKIKTHC